MSDQPKWPMEPLESRDVTYTLELDGRRIIVERVPARVNADTGEQFFSPETVERLMQFLERPTRAAPRH